MWLLRRSAVAVPIPTHVGTSTAAPPVISSQRAGAE